MKKAPTEEPSAAGASFSKKPLDKAASRKQDIAAPKPTPPPPPPPPPPPTKEPATRKAQATRGRPIGEIEIDAWEKAEMAKIKEKFDKVNGEIASWADKKKKKAKLKLDKIEGALDQKRAKALRHDRTDINISKLQAALDQKRAKALRHYRTDIQNIDYVAGGAKAQAEEKRRNEELKVKEKSKIIRETGQFPPTCLCF
ncbi:hypothetical protein CK203_016457 [Vitis vinifera]|nr:hypothetical protein CK203_016457 [Vitis vinifera]